MQFVCVKSKTILASLVCIALIILSSLNLFNGATAAGVYLGKNPKKLPIYAVETAENKMSISFDAAWGADKTEKLLTILKEYNVKTTFFLVGFWAEKYPELVKKIDSEGHEIGLHSNTHPDMTKLTKEQMKLELTTNNHIIKNITGKDAKVFRPPFGAYSNALIEVCTELKLKVIQWSIDSHDWMDKTAGEMLKKMQLKAKNGAIALFHNNSTHIVEALPAILDSILQKNLKLTTISDLIYFDNYTIRHDGTQIKNK